jgi:hypothetical protein
MRRGFALFWTLATAVIATVVGFFSYQAGWAAGLATKVPEGAVAPYYYYGPHFFGFFGLIPLLLLILLLAFIFRGGRRRGPGYWGGRPTHIEDRLQEWHRRAHGEEPPQGGSPASSA